MLFCRMLCSLVRSASCLLDAWILLEFFFSLYSVDQPSFFSSGAYLLGWLPMLVLVIFGCFLGSLLPNQKLVLILCLGSHGIP